MVPQEDRCARGPKPIRSGLAYRFRFTRSLRARLARKAGTVDALMFAALPVRGSRHSRAARFRVSKLPNPVIATFPPRFSSDAIIPPAAKKSSAISVALALVTPSRLATAATNSCLFTGGSLRGRESDRRTNIVERMNRPQGGWSFLLGALHF